MVSGKHLNSSLVVSFGDNSYESSFFWKWKKTDGKPRLGTEIIVFDAEAHLNICGSVRIVGR